MIGHGIVSSDDPDHQKERPAWNLVHNDVVVVVDLLSVGDTCSDHGD